MNPCLVGLMIPWVQPFFSAMAWLFLYGPSSVSLRSQHLHGSKVKHRVERTRQEASFHHCAFLVCRGKALSVGSLSCETGPTPCMVYMVTSSAQPWTPALKRRPTLLNFREDRDTFPMKDQRDDASSGQGCNWSQPNKVGSLDEQRGNRAGLGSNPHGFENPLPS